MLPVESAVSPFASSRPGPPQLREPIWLPSPASKDTMKMSLLPFWLVSVVESSNVAVPWNEPAT